MGEFLRIYERLRRFPGGRWLFGRGVGWRAPYFSSIRPYVAEYCPGYAEVQINDRFRTRNHIGTIHAIALCNLAELCAGLVMDSITSSPLRWIPKGMQVRYLRKARGRVTARCQFGETLPKVDRVTPTDFIESVTLEVEIQDLSGQQVCIAHIEFHLSIRPECRSNFLSI